MARRSTKSTRTAVNAAQVVVPRSILPLLCKDTRKIEVEGFVRLSDAEVRAIRQADAADFTPIAIDVDQGNFELAIRAWGNGSNPHPHFSYVTAFFEHNTLAVNEGGEGIAFPLEQTTDVAGDVDLNELVVNSAQGLDVEAQKADVTVMAEVFNELLPKIPLFERYGNNAALEGVRVAAWPADDDEILKNSPYADGIPTMLIYQGLLEPVTG